MIPDEGERKIIYNISLQRTASRLWCIIIKIYDLVGLFFFFYSRSEDLSFRTVRDEHRGNLSE